MEGFCWGLSIAAYPLCLPAAHELALALARGLASNFALVPTLDSELELDLFEEQDSNLRDQPKPIRLLFLDPHSMLPYYYAITCFCTLRCYKCRFETHPWFLLISFFLSRASSFQGEQSLRVLLFGPTGLGVGIRSYC